MRLNLKYLMSIAAFLLVSILTIVLISSCRNSKSNIVVNGLEYTLLESGDAYEVTGIEGCDGNEITISSEINGVPVRGIGASAFDADTTVKNVKIDPGISYIADGAFAGCTSLESVTLPITLTKIGNRAFEKCEKLAFVELGGVMHIGDYAFSECNSLKVIEIPDDTASLGSYAFYNSKALESVHVGLGLTEIGEYTFAGCSALISIRLHNDIKSIGESAFRDCLELSEVWLGYNLESIGANAFSGCEHLTYVYFVNFEGWRVEGAKSISFTVKDLTAPALVADYLSESFAEGVWKRAN